MSKVWSTGHVVVPKAMRERLGIHPGDEVDITDCDGAIVIRKVEPRRRAAASSEPRRRSS
jgi:AbrB family looped-hinge helix DNA binding protein